MIHVRKDDESFPFSRGILARSIATTGLPIGTIYEMVTSIHDELQAEGVETIDSKDLRKRVCEELRSRGYRKHEKHYLIGRRMAALDKPVIVLIGGATGVGKSVIAAELSNRFGIERVVGTDALREIMRYMVPEDLMPELHASSFETETAVRNPFVEDALIYGFSQQATLVCEGARAFIQRSKKEGLSAVVNGVHLVPGHLRPDIAEGHVHLFHYMLGLSDKGEHEQRFRLRARNSNRDPERYISEVEDIRRIQDYMRRMADEHNVQWIENDDLERTITTILNDVTARVEQEVRAE